MKKSMMCFLSLALIITCFTACDMFERKPEYDPSLKYEEKESEETKKYDECKHQWDEGIEIEGGLGGYVMEYTCLLCGIKERETITLIPPSGMSHSISYQSDRTNELLMEGYAPTEAKLGETVVLRTHPIMDADLAFYANGVKLTQTHADSDYWEYIFTMPDADVVITHEISDGFLSGECAGHIDDDSDDKCDVCSFDLSGHEHTYEYYQDETVHGWSYTCGCLTPPNYALHSDGNEDGKCDVCGYGEGEAD